MRKITGRKKSGPKKIGEVLPLLLARRGYADVQRSNALEQAWKSAAGIVLVRHSRVARIRGGVVEVIVRNSVTLQELTFRKATLVRALAGKLSGETVSDIKFRIGQIE